MPAILAENDKVRVRHHLGYLNTTVGSTFVLGVPAAIQPNFAVEGAMDRILPQALPKFLELLDRLDCVECEVFGGMDLASIRVIGDITVNELRRKELAGYYKIAQEALANLLGVPPNPYDQRSWLTGPSINVPVY